MILKNIEIKKVVFKGLGLGFDSNGAIFVDNSYPGDILDVEIFKSKGKVRFGKIAEVIEPSKMRKQANCEVFGSCGGCDWLDIDYQDQLWLKQEIIKEIFEKYHSVDSIIGSDAPLHYRNKSFLPVAQNPTQPVIGMFQKRSHIVVPHKSCQIQPEIFDQIAEEFMTYVVESKLKIYDEKTQKGTLRHLGFRLANDKILVILVTKSRKLPFSNLLIKKLTGKFPQITGIIQNINPTNGNVILGDSEKVLYGDDYLLETVDKIKYRLHYRSFFQINNSTTHKLYDYVRSSVGESKNLIDAYSGVGTISLYLSENVENIYGIESNAAAVQDAKENSLLNQRTNCHYYTALVEDKIAELCLDNSIDTIVFDPPRKGLDEKVISTLVSAKIPKIIYISCNPMTQKRDVDLLLQIGYQINNIQPFDMFPQTWHIENVIELEYVK